MPSHMLRDLLQALLGVIVFPLCFVTPGYLAGWTSNLMGFRTRSVPERILWAIALSGPFSTVLTCIGGRIIPSGPMVAILLSLGALALLLVATDIRHARGHHQLGREFWLTLACMTILTAYCLLATLGIQTHHSLYEGIIASDWSVRIPLVEAAVRAGVPPHNPLYAIDGRAPVMRYYYFWYILCAQIVRIAHITPRAALVASTVWSGFSLISVLFLYLKYMAPEDSFAAVCTTTSTPRHIPVRRVCLYALALACTMSLFLLPALLQLITHPRTPNLDPEFWLPDRMPSWVGAVLFAPHHIGGLAFGAAGFLLLALMPASRKQQLVHTLFAAVCFTALAGTSTYLALCFAIAGFFLFLVKLRARHWSQIGMLVVCAVTALLLARPFLHEMTSNSGYSASEHITSTTHQSLVANSMFKVVLRSWHTSFGIVGSTFCSLGHPLDHSPLRYVFPLIFLPVLYIFELGCFTCVLWYQAKLDFRGPRPPTERALLLWALFLGFALPALLLSSEPTQGINDLGRHAGLALRLVLILWAAPMFANTLQRLRSGCRPTPSGRWVVAFTTICFFIGLGGELWQISIDRLYLPLLAHHIVEDHLDFYRNAPFLQIRNANEALATAVPPDAIVQSNPAGVYQMLFTLYVDRQMAAGDTGCESAFGGNIDICKSQIVAPLQSLYGGTSGITPKPGDIPPPSPDPSLMTVAAMNSTCRQLHLSALLAARTDLAWLIPGTWVWTQPTLYADDSVRVIPCPI